MIEDLRALTVTMSGHDGHEIHGYFAEPLDDGSYGGAVVIHHLPGYDEESREITRKLAAHGYRPASQRKRPPQRFEKREE
jgi:carboxymethylenebutenolidase